MGDFYWLTESGANGSIVITPQVSCMLFDFPEMNLCFAQYGYKRIEFKGKVSVFCFAKNKIIFLLLTISDPQKRSLTLKYPEFFIHTINLPFLDKFDKFCSVNINYI